MVIYNVNPRVKKLFLAFHFFEWKIGIELRNSDIEMKIGKTTICAADIDRDKFQISELDPIQNLRKKKKNDQRKRNMRNWSKYLPTFADHHCIDQCKLAFVADQFWSEDLGENY